MFRMRKFLVKPLGIAWLLLVPFVAMSDSNKEGYWWKQEPPLPEEAEQEQPELSAPPSEAELLKKHPSEIAEMVEEYRLYALWKMEPESTKWYYQMQDFARRRSRAFMNVTEVVMLENPELNMNSVYPTSSPGRKARDIQRQDSINARLARERNNVALVLLTKESCSFCPAQRAALKHFQQRHGWSLKEFDIDKNPRVGLKFGTDYVPTTIAIFRGTEEWAPISIGVDSVPKIEENAYRAIRMLKGETNAERYTVQEYQEGGALDPQR